MGRGISEVITFAVGVAISPVPIVAVILMLFSQRARVNGPAFLIGWVAALAVLSAVVYVTADQSNASTSNTTSDTVSWGKIILGAAFLLLALRQWRHRPAVGAEPTMPKWMATIDELTPVKAVGFGVVLAGVNPKNLVLTIGAATGLAQLGLSDTDVVVSLVVFLAVASVTIAGPVLYYLFAGERARAGLDALKNWLIVHNGAVMTTLFVVFGVDLIAKGLPPLTT